MRASRVMAGVAVAAGVFMATSGPVAAAGSPTCVSEFEDFFGGAHDIANHGQHIVGDYVVGGHTEWPPAGQVGDVVGGRGPANPGAPGIHEHPFAPGASFCTDSNSPGPHL